MTSMPSSNSSSAICGVMPKPPAEFSPLAMVSSTLVLPLQFRQTFVNDGAPGPSENVTDEKYAQAVAVLQQCCISMLTRVPTVGFGSVRQLCGAQEIVVARGTQFDSAHAVGVHQHVIEIPKIDVWQVLGDDALDLVIDGSCVSAGRPCCGPRGSVRPRAGWSRRCGWRA